MSFVDKKKMGKKVLPVLLLAAVAAAVGVTGATVLHTLTLENPIKTPTVEGGIEEDLDDGAKVVSFRNTGEADVFLRVSYTESWTYTDTENNETLILPNEAVIVVDDDGNTKTVSVASPDWNYAGWQTDLGDGWYYYQYILPGENSGESVDARTTNDLVRAVNFVDLTKLLDERYKDADYEIHFVMEVVQASDEWPVNVDAVKEVLEKSVSNSVGWDDDGNWGSTNTKYDCVITWSDLTSD